MVGPQQGIDALNEGLDGGGVGRLVKSRRYSALRVWTSAAPAGALHAGFTAARAGNADRQQIPAGCGVDALPQRRQLILAHHRCDTAGVEALEFCHPGRVGDHGRHFAPGAAVQSVSVNT